MFFLHTAKDVLILLIYVDEILVTGSDPHRVSSFASHLNAIFALRDLGRLHYFLGLEIMQTENSIHLNQHKYVHDFLQRTSMLDPGLLLHLVWLVKIYPNMMEILSMMSHYIGTELMLFNISHSQDLIFHLLSTRRASL